MKFLVFGSPIATMAILSRIETSRCDAIHLHFGGLDLLRRPTHPASDVQLIDEAAFADADWSPLSAAVS
jgi:hypothetical protein